MNKIISGFLGMGSAITMLLIYAVSCGTATIIENNYDTPTAWSAVYGATWFALLQLLLGINLLYNIFRYKLITLKKLPSFLFHFSFIIILIGAGITRYFGFEGVVHIRNGESTDELWTSAVYLQLIADDGKNLYQDNEEKHISLKGDNDFSMSVDVNGKKATYKYKDYIRSADFAFTDSKDGKPVINLIISGNGSSNELVLEDNTSNIIDGIEFAFNKEPNSDKFVKFTLKDDKWLFTSNEQISYFTMSENAKDSFDANSINEFKTMRLYTVSGINFAPKFLSKSASKKLVSVDGGNDAMIGELEFNGEKQDVPLFTNGKVYSTHVGGVEFVTKAGSLKHTMPFVMHLNAFKLDRYPGSNSPMSYSSDITIFDKNGNKIMDYLIYMNNVLDFNGHRFFQSSYDMDERGTILSVNKDPGKIPTYIGYFLLGLGFFLNLISPYSRFRKLANLVNSEATKTLSLMFAIFLAFTGVNLKASDVPSIDKNHAKELSSLLVQSVDGRIKPFDTVGYEVLNKIYRSSSFNGMSPTEVMLSMMLNSDYWQEAPLIAISNKELKKLLGVDENAKYAKFSDFFTISDGKMSYKLAKTVELTNRKNPATRGMFDKDVIKVDERVNILYMVFMGEIFRIFPKIDDPNNTWYSPAAAIMSFPKEESNQVASILQNYFRSIIYAQSSGDWKQANDALNVLKEYQSKYGASILIDQKKIDMELLLNKYNIFDRLSPFYLISGLILLAVVFIKMVRPKTNVLYPFRFVYFLNLVLFLALTAGLGMRWYVSQHAPWSNAYESLIYVAWAMALSGLIFAKRSPVTIALTSILTGVTLFVAHLSWLDPQITTLVPVLNSYWLTIHVSVITASYGFLGLCALLGIFTLILMCFQGKKENKEISRNILEATRINEMSMIFGISLLTLGNFLGGVWANESWGRYWGWDSKETWALISIIVYAVVLHLRFIPKLNNQYAFGVASSFAYWSIIMTYFGVNFYLSGMHSYAAGDPVPVPNFVGIIATVMIIITLIASRGIKFAKKL